MTFANIQITGQTILIKRNNFKTIGSFNIKNSILLLNCYNIITIEIFFFSFITGLALA